MTMKSLIPPLFVTGLVLVLLSAASCGGGSSAPGDAPAKPAARPAAKAPAESSTARPASAKAEETGKAAEQAAAKAASDLREEAAQAAEAVKDTADGMVDAAAEKAAETAGKIADPAGALASGTEGAADDGDGEAAAEEPAGAGGGGAAPSAGAPMPAPRVPRPADGPLAWVLVKTSLGDIVLELNREKAPETVKNFLSYADRQFYHGTVFHRVIPTFMIQGGGFTADMNKKPTDPAIVNEWQNGLQNKRGTVAMARLGGKPDSATSQFFINVVDNASLDQPRDGAAYAVFGRVVAGMDAVDAIKGVPTTRQGPHQNVPVEPVEILEVHQITEQQAMKRSELERQLKGE